MRTTLLLLATALVPALTADQGQERPLSYRGWALGISFDSAKALTKAQISKPLVCVGAETDTMFCQTDLTVGSYAGLYFSPAPRRLEEVSLQIPLDRRASRDSLEKWFVSRWGPSIPREVLGKPNPKGGVHAEDGVIGSWARPGMIFGMASIASVDAARLLSVAIYNPARQIRLMQQRADSSRNQR
jgi:hypothetical protein